MTRLCLELNSSALQLESMPSKPSTVAPQKYLSSLGYSRACKAASAFSAPYIPAFVQLAEQEVFLRSENYTLVLPSQVSEQPESRMCSWQKISPIECPCFSLTIRSTSLYNLVPLFISQRSNPVEKNTVLFLLHILLGILCLKCVFVITLTIQALLFHRRNPSLICLHILNVTTQYIQSERERKSLMYVKDLFKSLSN